MGTEHLSVPHGGVLRECGVPPEGAGSLRDQADSLPRLNLNARQMSDVELLAVGAVSPLTGFMGRDDYETVLREMRLKDGTVWTLPVVLGVGEERYRSLQGRTAVALCGPDGIVRAVLRITDRFSVDLEREALSVYRTKEQKHPGVAAMIERGPFLVGGEVQVIDLPSDRPFSDRRLTPRQTRAHFEREGWKTVVGFQTRNPVHRAHEYIQKCALETCDGLLLHPIVGETKSDDVPATVRMECYEALLKNCFPPHRVLLSVNPSAMHYAGPREAVHHAIVRKNYGCTHFIVGRDHAGVGSYYGPYDAQKIFSDFQSGELGITPVFFDSTFWCSECKQVVSSKTCPHPASDHRVFSGSAVREMLLRGEIPPPEFTHPKIAEILIKHYKSK
ncbi:MAG TPA: sulfate adenylyltransferase [Elusimicrobiota bacterium]|nr:sulfate adenylyltransferase [Elusimicrobiota bacterium]